jgi:hypothetical protein
MANNAQQWSNFVINADNEFNATRCQIQLVKKQHANQFVTVYCTTTVPDSAKDVSTIKTPVSEKRNNNRFLVCGTSTGQIHVYQLSNSLKPLSFAPVVTC